MADIKIVMKTKNQLKESHNGNSQEKKPKLAASKKAISKEKRPSHDSPNRIEWGAESNPFHQKKNQASRKTAFKQLMLSIIGALLIGTIMGFSVLKLFFSDRTGSSVTIDTHLPQTTTKQIASKNIVWPSLNAVLLQAGSFSEKEGAEKMLQIYKQKGVQAVMSKQAPYRIYLGIAPDREQALLLSNSYQAKGIQVYMKTLNTPSKQMEVPHIDTELNTEGIKNGLELFHQLSTASTSFFKPGTNQRETFTHDGEWNKMHQSFLTTMNQMKPNISSNMKPLLEEMIRAFDQVMLDVKEAQKKPSAEMTAKLQESLIYYALSYESLINQIHN
ncbi:SPOR domain-containing protein [Hazenella sp. IB182353]|uniref:SPOR domain-containing protein n=1 Tax=Polycladospora coralii TaxID=2771432 RepID=UPI00174662EB|nr:SPOR domain-containing protein [Polycladospora coralii]MBS7529241.1 SPOR domain-containing protein [Polycladospora coralii]